MHACLLPAKQRLCSKPNVNILPENLFLTKQCRMPIISGSADASHLLLASPDSLQTRGPVSLAYLSTSCFMGSSIYSGYFKVYGYTSIFSPTCVQRETISVISWLLTWRTKSSKNGVISYRKEFAPMEQILSFMRLHQFILETTMKMTATSPESEHFHFKNCGDTSTLFIFNKRENNIVISYLLPEAV